MAKFWKKKPDTARNGGGDGNHPVADRSAEHRSAEDRGGVSDRGVDDRGSEAQVVEERAGQQSDIHPQDTQAMPASAASQVPASELAIPADLFEARGKTAPPAPEPLPPSWRERLSGSGFARGLGSLFARNPQLDEELLEELETCLLTSDVGVTASTELIEDLRRRMQKREFADAAALRMALRKVLTDMLAPVAQTLRFTSAHPFVILAVGVNGVGKTTTIGKLAHHLGKTGHSAMLAAGDTFRAAAVAQLQAWGERNRIPVLAQGQGADSASVIFDALQAARSRDVDVLIADTAGRLHTQSGLMDELRKVRRVLAKLDPEAPHEVLMVIDATTGQNAISQVRQFREAADVSGLVITKLDGTAKGGVVFALAREFGLPIRFVGLGEGIEDLRPFDPAAFVDGLLPGDMERAA